MVGDKRVRVRGVGVLWFVWLILQLDGDMG